MLLKRRKVLLISKMVLHSEFLVLLMICKVLLQRGTAYLIAAKQIFGAA